MVMEHRRNGILCLAILCLFWCFPVLARGEGRITIDTNKVYEGMSSSFAKGYEPSVQKHTMSLVIPFRAGMGLEGDKINVGISFEKEEESPFYYKNYQKRVKRSKDGVYLYRCKVKLKKDRKNGQYPLHLLVQAQPKGEAGFIQQEFTVYVEITDGLPKNAEAGQEEEGGAESGSISDEASMMQDGLAGGADPLPDPSPSTEETKRQPRILVSQNSLQGTAVQAGERAAWAISARNCSSRQAVENLKVTLLCESRELSFEKTSWYFERAGAGQSMDLSQNITVGQKAAAEPVAVQFQFDYEDKDGNSYSTTETVSLMVRQSQQAALAGVSFPEGVYESESEPLTFQVQNTGLAVLYNVRVCFEGKGLFPDKEMYLGNLEAGASLDGEIKVFVGTLDMDADGLVIEGAGEKYGKTEGEVILSYEDEQGKVEKLSQKLHTTIQKPQVVELSVEKEAPKTNQWWITIVILAMVTMALAMLCLYLRMKHYQKIYTNAISGK